MKVSDLKEDDALLCKVEKIEGASVFLEIIGCEECHASMVLSEVAAGRIRNLRDYVFPNKKIVCKVLRISKNHIEMSLRRVTAGERDEVIERTKREKSLKKILSTSLDNASEIIDKIKDKYDILDFLQNVRENPALFEEFIGKDKAERISKILSEKEDREKVVKGKFVLKSDSEAGLRDIKEILNLKDAEVHYLGSSIFSISVSGRDFKEANNVFAGILKEIEKRAKAKGAIFELVKEK